MYEQHFSMTSRPFGSAPDVERYFPATAIDDARQRIVFCIERGDGPAVVIGSPGIGKTLLLEVLASTFRERFDVVLPTGTQLCTRRALLQVILHSLDMPYENLGEGELRLTLIDRLQREDNASEGLLLLIDEAQSLPLKLLEELRMLTNLFKNRKPCMQLVLAGPSLLEERLGGPSLELLQQRIASRCYLEPMDCNETRQYVQSRIIAAGGSAEALFDDEALDAVFRSTDGVPRLINQLCDHALLLAAIAEESRVSDEAVDEAWRDLQQLPAPTPSEIISTSEDTSVIEFGSLDDFDMDESDDVVIADEPVEAEVNTFEENIVDDSAGEEVPSQILDDAELKIEAIQRKLSSNDWSDKPAANSPFEISFDDEEVVEDRFASMSTTANEVATSKPPLTELDSNGESLASETTIPETDDAEPLERFEPTPLITQPEESRWDADPVLPEMTQSEALSPTLPRFGVVGSSDLEEEPAKGTSATAVAIESEPLPTVAASGLRFGQLFASLRRE